MNNASISRIGIIIYALVIGYFGINHFLYNTGLQKQMPKFLPYSSFWLYLTGVLLVAAAIALLIGKQVRVAGLFLALFLILIVLTVHLPAIMNSTEERQVSIAVTNLIKDTGLAGAALVIAGRAS